MEYMAIFVAILMISCDDVFSQAVHGNCAVGSNCDHCPNDKVKLMQDPVTKHNSHFKVCCSNCNKYFFSFNVLQNSYCTCMNIPETAVNNVQNNLNGLLFNSVNSGITNTNYALHGNCWTGSNCTGCGGKSIVNGISVCCPNCNGYPMSLSTYNNNITCQCPQPLQNQRTNTGNCLYNNACRNCTSASYVNGMRVCCPNCGSGFKNLMSFGLSTHCEC